MSWARTKRYATMKGVYCVLTVLFCFTAHAQNLANNRNLLVVRVGSGSSILTNSATAVYLDEYTPAGVLVKTIPMPTIDAGTNKKLTLSGTSAFEGYPVLSPDEETVSLFGYNSAPGTSSVSTTTTGRTIGIINSKGIINASTTITDAFSGQTVGAAVFDGDNGIWMAGGNAVRYAALGASTSTILASTGGRGIGIFNGQLYLSSVSGSTRLATVGPGVLPIAWQTITNLSGEPYTTSSPCQFFLVDACNSVPGMDVLYIADYNAGILKYSLVNGTWVSNGKIGIGNDQYAGITGSADNGNIVMYAIRKSGTGSNGGGELVSIIDNNGYNGSFTAAPTVLATAQNNTVFRGISYGFKSLSPLPVSLGAFNVAKQNGVANITWNTYSEKQSDFFDIQRSQDGEQFQSIGTVKAAGNSNKKIAYNYLDKNPPVGLIYYLLKQVDVDGQSSLSDIKSLRFNIVSDGMKISCINIHVTEFLISMPQTDRVTLKIYDTLGKLIGEERLYLQQGTSNVKPAVNLVPGVYIATLNGDTGGVKIKFIKQ